MSLGLDLDSSGDLDTEEVRLLCERAGLVSDEDVDRVVAEMETPTGNGDHIVTFSEFAKWCVGNVGCASKSVGVFDRLAAAQCRGSIFAGGKQARNLRMCWTHAPLTRPRRLVWMLPY